MALPKQWVSRQIKASTLEYEQAVYRLLGLPHPDKAYDGDRFYHYLGTFRPADSDSTVTTLALKRIRDLRERLERQVDEGTLADLNLRHLPHGAGAPENSARKSWNVHHALALNYLFLDPREFFSCVRREGGPPYLSKSVEHSTWGDGKPMTTHTTHYRPEHERYRCLTDYMKRVPPEFTADMTGYIAYLRQVAPNFVSFLERDFPVLLPEGDRQRHTYITGGTGSGKSELLKLLIHSSVLWGKGAVVVLDPHGSLASEISHWPEFAAGSSAAGRLVLIDPSLSNDHTPTFNPLDLPKGAGTPAMVSQFVIAFEDMLRGETGGTLTVNMTTIIEHCVHALLETGGKSLADLLTFMNDERNAGLINEAKRVLGGMEADFFAGDFQSKDFRQTKQSIANKLRRVLRSAWPLFVGKSTLDLEQSLNQRKIIIFNLSRGKMGIDASEAFGRLILAQLQGLALRRESIPEGKRVPVHVFVDECQNYISRATVSILEEARKYRLFLTLAQQTVGRGVSNEVRDVILSNTLLKLTGRNNRDSYQAISKATNTPIEALEALKDREFSLQASDRSALKLRPASHLVGKSHSMSDAQWQTLKAEQISLYYRPLSQAAQPPQGDDAPKDDVPADQADWKPKYDL